MDPAGNEPVPDVELVRVQWDGSEAEPDQLAKCHPNYPDLLAAYKAQGPKTTNQVEDPRPRDLHLPNHMRQGIPSSPPCSNLPWGITRLVRRLVKLDPIERNPDCDIDPPLHHTIQIGVRYPKQVGPDPGTTETAYVYLPDGTLAGLLSLPCLHRLWAQYEHAKATDPTAHKSLGATTFEKDVAQLLLRYRQRRTPPPTNDGRRTPMAPSRSCTDELWLSLKEALSITTERFASPMDRNRHSEAYWSAFPQDGLFGTNHNAYSTPWTDWRVPGPCGPRARV
jgi:hypothetical protein